MTAALSFEPLVAVTFYNPVQNSNQGQNHSQGLAPKLWHQK